MRYSELVNAIKTNTLADLDTLLYAKALCVISGSTRHAFMFDTHVVKVNKYHHGDENHNEQEYAHYCQHKTGVLNVPIVYTRLYRTLDGYAILIQERMTKIFELLLSSEVASATAMYESTVRVSGSSDDSQWKDLNDWEARLIAMGIPKHAFRDGLQCGYNKQEKIVFFDYSRVWSEVTWS